MYVAWFFVFFLASGFCSLVDQIVWLRLAMAQFGVTTPLISIVLSIFMGGLAIGSWGGGLLTRELREKDAGAALRWYGVIEAVIGVSAYVVPRSLDWGGRMLTHLGGDWASLSFYTWSSFYVAFAILPFCVCMGATFPVAMEAIRRLGAGRGERSFSLLYLANVIGATAGTLGSAFVMIELWGFHGTLLTAARFNFLVAAAALTLGFLPTREPATVEAAAASEAEPTVVASPAIPGLLFLTGLVSMGMEIVWTRLFTAYLGNEVYAFATILAWYLAATFIGSWLYRVWSAGRPAEALEAMAVRMWPVVAVLGLLPLLGADPRIAGTDNPAAGQAAVIAGFGKLLIGSNAVAVGMAPFCAALGFLTPLLMDAWSRGAPERAGRAYALNIVGCILGPLLAGFGLLPAVGERWSLIILALPVYAVAIAGLRGRQRATAAIAVGASAVVGVALAAGTVDFETSVKDRVVKRDYTATVIASGQGFYRQLMVNGVGMTKLTPITKMMAHLPLAYNTAKPDNALAICFGMGTAFRSLLSWPIHVTVVELVPSVPTLVGFYQVNGEQLLNNPNGTVVVDDGRRFLRRTGQTFDVITIDPPPPTSAAASSLLYSQEFYAAVKLRLRPTGILQQWIPGGDLPTQLSFIRAVQTSFPYVRIYPGIEGWGYHLLASKQPIPTRTPAELAGRLPPAAAKDLVEWGPFKTPEQQFAAVVTHEYDQRGFTTDGWVPPLVDDRPINEYYWVRHGIEHVVMQ